MSMIPNKPTVNEKERAKALESFLHGEQERKTTRSNRKSKMYNLSVPLEIYQEAKLNAVKENIGLAEYYINAIIEANERLTIKSQALK